MLAVRYFAATWKAPQSVDEAHRNTLAGEYEKDLNALLVSLPSRFHPFIRHCLDSLPAILSLPMALLHDKFTEWSLLVDPASCHLVGLVGWFNAKIAPFGLDLYYFQIVTNHVHLRDGLVRFEDYVELEELFWTTFGREAGGLSPQTIGVIKSARILGLLRSYGFTPRLATMSKPVPVQDDENGAYNIRILDGMLINPATRLTELA